MERPERVPQLYGYTVRLVTLVWALGTGIAVVENVQTLMSPAYSRQNEYGTEPSITSFEAFRLTDDRARRFNKEAVSLLLAVGLFMFHWRWLRRQPTTVAAT